MTLFFRVPRGGLVDLGALEQSLGWTHEHQGKNVPDKRHVKP